MGQRSKPAPGLLALDVGGANLKAAHSDGDPRSIPFALWKQPDDLADRLVELVEGFPETGRLALTMTAELCDCFATKAEGVRFVLVAVAQAFPDRAVLVWGTDGRFHTVADMNAHPLIAASANWLALATVAARLVPKGPAVLVDVGSTTTDIIPISDGKPVPAGHTDGERLRNGELVYAGVRRTPVMALATSLPFRKATTGLAAELFATTLDVYLALGNIPPSTADRETADGRPATVVAARSRLARMVGEDADSFTAADAKSLARAADEAFFKRLAASGLRACRATIGKPTTAVVAGSGEFLARRVAEGLIGPGGAVVSLAEAWGPSASTAACAYALLKLATDEGTFS